MSPSLPSDCPLAVIQFDPLNMPEIGWFSSTWRSAGDMERFLNYRRKAFTCGFSFFTPALLLGVRPRMHSFDESHPISGRTPLPLRTEAKPRTQPFSNGRETRGGGTTTSRSRIVFTTRPPFRLLAMSFSATWASYGIAQAGLPTIWAGCGIGQASLPIIRAGCGIDQASLPPTRADFPLWGRAPRAARPRGPIASRSTPCSRGGRGYPPRKAR